MAVLMAMSINFCTRYLTPLQIAFRQSVSARNCVSIPRRLAVVHWRLKEDLSIFSRSPVDRTMAAENGEMSRNKDIRHGSTGSNRNCVFRQISGIAKE